MRASCVSRSGSIIVWRCCDDDLVEKWPTISLSRRAYSLDFRSQSKFRATELGPQCKTEFSGYDKSVDQQIARFSITVQEPFSLGLRLTTVCFRIATHVAPANSALAIVFASSLRLPLLSRALTAIAPHPAQY